MELIETIRRVRGGKKLRRFQEAMERSKITKIEKSGSTDMCLVFVDSESPYPCFALSILLIPTSIAKGLYVGQSVKTLIEFEDFSLEKEGDA